MAFLAGDFTEVTVQHPGLGAFRYFPKAKESAPYDKGGLRSNDDESSLTASGQNIVGLSPVRWSMELVIAVDLESDYENSSMTGMAGSPLDGVWIFTHISGAIFKGTGRPVGDIKTDADAATMKVKIAGGGQLEEIG